MTPIEKAENALNSRIERIQANLRDAKSEVARQLQFQALVGCIGIGEALRDYIQAIGEYARGRHVELKQASDALTARHAQVLERGQELLERFKGSPGDSALREEIELAKRDMAVIQKTLRRGADSLRRDVAPSMAIVDPLALTIRRFSEADQTDTLKRTIKSFLEQVRELYRTQESLPSKKIIDAATWENSALTEIDRAAGFHEAFARAGYQAILAIDVMSLAVSATPPQTGEEAASRAQNSVATRLKQIAARLTTP